MIAAQKQLIENAETIQERIAQVQREGKVYRLETDECMAETEAGVVFNN